MKILVLAPQPFFVERGTPIAVRMLLRALSEAGHEVCLLTLAEGRDVDLPGLEIERIRRLPGVHDVPIGFSLKKLVCDAQIALRMAVLTATRRFDVVHAVEEAVFFAAAWPLRGARLVYDMDSSMADQLVEKWPPLASLGGLLRRFEHFAVRRADLVLPVCRALADKVHGYAPDAQVQILEDVALAPDHPVACDEDLRALTGDSRLILLYVGNLEHYQGMDLLLESLHALDADQRPMLIAIGGDERDIARYRLRVRELGLEADCQFLGPRPVDHLMHYLGQADILVSPRTRGSNTPMKVYSYLAAGVPLLATRIESHLQVLDDEIACLADPEPRAMAAGLQRLVADGDYRSRLAAAARARAEARHTYAAFKRRLLDAYAKLEDTA